MALVLLKHGNVASVVQLSTRVRCARISDAPPPPPSTTVAVYTRPADALWAGCHPACIRRV